jgi:hypothetical protein
MKQPRMLHGPAAPKKFQTDFPSRSSQSRRSYRPGLVKIRSPLSGTQPPTNYPPARQPSHPRVHAQVYIGDCSLSHMFNTYSQSSRTQQDARMLVRNSDALRTLLFHRGHSAGAGPPLLVATLVATTFASMDAAVMQGV